MSTPTKNLTYLTGIYPFQRASLPHPGPPLFRGIVGLQAQVAPPLWRQISYIQPQPRAGRILKVIAIRMQAMTAAQMTLFWRDSNALPLRGQRYPLSR